MRGFCSIIISKAAIVLALVLFVGAGCQYHDQKKAFGGNQSFSKSALIDATLVRESVLASCLNCHSGQSAPLLNSTDAIRASLAKVLAAIDKNAMPPASGGYSPLSDCQKAILHKWAELGAAESTTATVGELAACAGSENGTGAEPPVPLSQAPLTYQTFLTRILQPKCMTCQRADNTDDPDAAEMLFYPYSELASHKRLFAAPAATGKFIHEVTRNDEDRMPPPDSKVAPLTQEELDFAMRWIDAGIPE